MTIAAWGLVSVVVPLVIAATFRSIGWWVEQIAARRAQERTDDADKHIKRDEQDATIQEIYTRQVQMLMDDFRQQLQDRDRQITTRDLTIVQLRGEIDAERTRSDAVRQRRQEDIDGPG